MPTGPTAFSIAQAISTNQSCDVAVFNGTIARANVLEFVELVFSKQSFKRLLLILVTDGGDPDAAYKMSRYVQRRYEHVTLLVSGSCKSAGTLMAVGANEVAFAPYGELGPLDIQTYMTDNLSGMESGLTITEAIETLVRKSTDLHREHYNKIMASTGRVISFASAAKVATEFSTALFSPIFGRIDPYDVGQKARSMRIANDYGERLSQRSGSLKPAGLDRLTRGYPSHSFVIDLEEAGELFNHCRSLNDDEAALVDSLGPLSREEMRLGGRPLILFLSAVDSGGSDENGERDADDLREGHDGRHPEPPDREVADAVGEQEDRGQRNGGGLAQGDEPAEAPSERHAH